MAQVRYRPVDYSNEIEEALEDKQNNIAKPEIDDKAPRKQPKTIKDILSFENIAWVAIAILVCYLTDFVSVLMYEDFVDRSWFIASIFFLLISVTIFIFLSYYASLVRGISSDEWNQQYPPAIPIATASTILFELCLCISIWPVYHLLSIPILFIFSMALVCIICMLDLFPLLFKSFQSDN